VLVDELQKAKQREQIAKWDAGERRLAEQLKLDVPKTALSTDVHTRLDLWRAWCAEKSVRHCPAKPAVVAAWIVSQTNMGMHPRDIFAVLAAIDELHAFHGLASPTTAPLARQALEQIIRTEAPRSWPAAEKIAFFRLPVEIREIIQKRESERETALRRSQNKYAEAIKELRRQGSAAETATNEDVEK
jgi:hypothetical protein